MMTITPLQRMAPLTRELHGDSGMRESYCPASCLLDSTETYRFELRRRWLPGGGLSQIALFIMLNPSTADALKDDATIRRCNWFCRDWGLAGFDVLNLFALRATDPTKLRAPYSVAGDRADQLFNDSLLYQAARGQYAVTIFAWGANGGLANRDQQVAQFWKQPSVRQHPMCFGVTKAGHPLHPLRLSKTSKLFPYVPRAA